jgi:hypothetical protein
MSRVHIRGVPPYRIVMVINGTETVERTVTRSPYEFYAPSGVYKLIRVVDGYGNAVNLDEMGE